MQLTAKRPVVMVGEPFDQRGHRASARDPGKRMGGRFLDRHLGSANSREHHRFGPLRPERAHGREGLNHDARLLVFGQPADRQLEAACTLTRGENGLDGGAPDLAVAMAPERLDRSQGGPRRRVAAHDLEQGHANRGSRAFVQPVDRHLQHEVAAGLRPGFVEATDAPAVREQVPAVAKQVLLERGDGHALDREVAGQRLAHVAAKQLAEELDDARQELDVAGLAEDFEPSQRFDRVFGQVGPRRLDQQSGDPRVAVLDAGVVEQARLVRPEAGAELVEQRIAVAAERPQHAQRERPLGGTATGIQDPCAQACLGLGPALDLQHGDHGLRQFGEPAEERRLAGVFGALSSGLDECLRDGEIFDLLEPVAKHEVRPRADARRQDRGAADPARIVGWQHGHVLDQLAAGDERDPHQFFAGPRRMGVEQLEYAGKVLGPEEDPVAMGCQQEPAGGRSEA